MTLYRGAKRIRNIKTWTNRELYQRHNRVVVRAIQMRKESRELMAYWRFVSAKAIQKEHEATDISACIQTLLYQQVRKL